MIVQLPSKRALSAFIAWALASGLTIFGILSLWTIGILVLPVGLVLVFLTVRRFGFGAPSLGGIAGVGLLLVSLGFASLGNHPCGGSFTLGFGGFSASVSNAPAQCGGMAPAPLLVVGAALIICASLMFVLATTWPRHPSHT